MAYDDAKQLTIKKDSEKKAFIKKHFNGEIDDPQNYDLIINKRIISASAAVKAIKDALSFLDAGFQKKILRGGMMLTRVSI